LGESGRLVFDNEVYVFLYTLVATSSPDEGFASMR